MYKYKGKILVSRPIIYDDIFNRTVVLIVEDNESGTLGFILNRPSDNEVSQLVDEIDSSHIVFEGGPVHQQRLFYIHNRPDLIKDSKQISDTYYWSGSFEDVQENLSTDRISEDEIRFFLGYSGWEEGQLQRELDKNAWLVMENNFNLLSFWGVDLWKRQLTLLGGEHLLWLNMPENPLLN